MQVIRDPLWQNVELPDSLIQIIRTEEFSRLNEIRQLGPTYLVYPGATHTRFSHSIGVYEIASRLIEHLVKNGADFLDENDILAFKMASLCHDLGHFPYTHALKELPLEEHERLTAKIILDSGLTSIIRNAGIEPYTVAAIIDDEMELSENCSDSEKIVFFRKLLSGVLDPDKLDYLNRDAFFCGVPYGVQDTEFALANLSADKNRGIVANSKSILSIENLLFSKYLMYRAVYWHKDVRIATAMMKKTLFSALEQGEIQPAELYELTDNQLISIVNKKMNKKIWLPAQKLARGNLYRIVSEVPFDENNPVHKEMENLAYRAKIEDQIASELKIDRSEILIDIPERISFESNIWISDENCEFSKSTTVFSENTVKSFTDKLRRIRVALDSERNFSENEEVIINRILSGAENL